MFIKSSCALTKRTNPLSQINRRGLYEETLTRRGATVGANATIVYGISIGRYAFIAAGAVVTCEVPDYALMVGVLGRHVGWMNRHGHILEFGAAQPATCPESGFEYELRDGNVRCLSLDDKALLPVELSCGQKSYDDFTKTPPTD